jgi:hypothetical protein
METQDKTKGIGFSVRTEDLQKVEEIKKFFEAKNNSEAVRIAIDIAYSFTQGAGSYEVENK